MPRGGYRAPAKPAPVSGPGAASQRTDGGAGQPVRALTDAAYGEQATYRADQQGAPMATAQQGPQGAGMPAADTSSVVGFGEPSAHPNMPVTAGAASGAGPGLEALGMQHQETDPANMQAMRELLPMFELAANLPTSSFQFRQFVRRLRARAV